MPNTGLIPQGTSNQPSACNLDSGFQTSLPQPSGSIRPQSENSEGQLPNETQQQRKPISSKRLHAAFIECSSNLSPLNLAKQISHKTDFNRFITHWLESIPIPNLYRERHSSSDSFLNHLKHGHTASSSIRSMSVTEKNQDADGTSLVQAPASARSSLRREYDENNKRILHSRPPTQATTGLDSGSNRTVALVQNPRYRSTNLAANNIYFLSDKEKLPKDITELVHLVSHNGDSGLPLNGLQKDEELTLLGIGAIESELQVYFYGNLFPRPKLTCSLQCTQKLPMAKHAVPSTGSILKVSIPVPDILYGYRNAKAFPQQKDQLLFMKNEMVANSQDMMYPFLSIDLKADGPSGAGSLWVATNQCLGSSTTCVNIVELLNIRLRHSNNSTYRLINGAAFSIAMNATEARLYVTWKCDEFTYYMAQMDSFLLQRPSDYVSFSRQVKNIIDWGMGERLDGIQRSLDALFKERKAATSLYPK